MQCNNLKLFKESQSCICHNQTALEFSTCGPLGSILSKVHQNFKNKRRRQSWSLSWRFCDLRGLVLTTWVLADWWPPKRQGQTCETAETTACRGVTAHYLWPVLHQTKASLHLTACSDARLPAGTHSPLALTGLTASFLASSTAKLSWLLKHLPSLQFPPIWKECPIFLLMPLRSVPTTVSTLEYSSHTVKPLSYYLVYK